MSVTSATTAAALQVTPRIQQAAATTTALAAANGQAPAPTAAPAQAQQGAAQAQPGATQPQGQQQAPPEAYNAPVMRIRRGATTRDVLVAFQRAMADPGINKTTYDVLQRVHDMIFQAQREATSVILDGMRR